MVAAIVPWNFPQMHHDDEARARAAPPAAPSCSSRRRETALDSYILAEACEEAGLPAGVLNIVPAGPEAGEHLVTPPGRRQGQLHRLDRRRPPHRARCAARASAASRSSSAASRRRSCSRTPTSRPRSPPARHVGVRERRPGVRRADPLRRAPRDRYDEVVDGLAELASALMVGDPRDPGTDVGPLAAERQRDAGRGLHRRRPARRAPASSPAAAGRPASTRGWYVEPTVFADVDNDMRVAREEIFGPVLCVIPATDDEEAIAIANDSDYGLGGIGLDGRRRAAGWPPRARCARAAARSTARRWASTCPFGGFKAQRDRARVGPGGRCAPTSRRRRSACPPATWTPHARIANFI